MFLTLLPQGWKEEGGAIEVLFRKDAETVRALIVLFCKKKEHDLVLPEVVTQLVAARGLSFSNYERSALLVRLLSPPLDSIVLLEERY